ncbi:hypothetical protein NDU88_001936 [Pleurodeles waltl]|uniref:Uncharacterized protein n=1 Tax=Pleurodeles waltl TaxID=8319 RepID=A0AAV7UW52_PLEWA|nr:hypothetical protein NDU88_001936 [Pleurodeles waltl]
MGRGIRGLVLPWRTDLTSSSWGWSSLQRRALRARPGRSAGPGSAGPSSAGRIVSAGAPVVAPCWACVAEGGGGRQTVVGGRDLAPLGISWSSSPGAGLSSPPGVDRVWRGRT